MSITVVAEKCCGCRACMNICPTYAIHFDTDEYGFEYPVLDESKCVHCNKCEKVCPALSLPQNKEHFRCGAAYAKDDRIKYDGSSGGLFGLFAKKIIDDEGSVYGAAFDESLKLKTRSAQTIDELIPIYKSKYLLCDTDGQFENIKNDLNTGRQVLYCSSPCQVQALKLYLGKEYDNLITIDFVCHGVGSQTMFDSSIGYTEAKNNVKIKRYMFRYKKGNATSHYYSYDCEKNGKIGVKSDIYLFDPYYTAYQKRIACRASCYDCRYASELRPSDITIGDFHTINKYYSDIDRFAGVSMFVCNTEKGRDFLNSIEKELEIRDMDWNVLKGDNRFDNTEKVPALRESFLSTVKDEGFDKAVDKYLRPSLNWTHIVYYRAPKFLRKIAFKMLGK